MKKIIYIAIAFFIISYFMFCDNHKIIGDDSIRFRIIANSNDAKDQAIKMNIKKELEKEFLSKLNTATSKEDAERIIKDNIPTIDNTLKKYNLEYSINYGENYFPTKHYEGTEYESGYYDSLVISLGEAEGNNWWCVMYPPLCLMDNETEEEPEYSFFTQKIFSKIFS